MSERKTKERMEEGGEFKEGEKNGFFSLIS
jgi:hypothetical protein